jgi:hypothetical protein
MSITRLYKWLVGFIAIFFMLCANVPFAACYGDNHPRMVWQVTGLGKPADLSLGPNGLFYLSSGNKLITVDDYGRKLWEMTLPGSDKAGRPVFDEHGAIFYSGSFSIQEIKLNGGTGWNFKVYQEQADSASQLTFGPGNLLYLPLPSGLYAVDAGGRFKWMMQQWDSWDANRAVAVKGREILACAGNDRAVFVVTGKDSKGRSLVAVNGKGEIVWRFGLGEVKEIKLVTGLNGRLYVTVNPVKIDRLNHGKVYAFDSEDGSRPLWSFSVDFNNLTALTLSEHGLLYFCAGNKLFALDQADGQEVWSDILSEGLTQPAVDESTRRVYLGADDKRLLALNPQGQLDWDFSLDGNVSCLPIAFPGGILYVATDKGSLYKIKDE